VAGEGRKEEAGRQKSKDDEGGSVRLAKNPYIRVCQVICVNDLGFVVGVELGVELGIELGLMLVQSSVTCRRRGCGNVGIPRLLRDFQVRWERWKSRGRTFPRVPPRVISTAKLFPGSCGEPVFVGC
jgi:hypothetical protein